MKVGMAEEPYRDALAGQFPGNVPVPGTETCRQEDSGMRAVPCNQPVEGLDPSHLLGLDVECPGAPEQAFERSLSPWREDQRLPWPPTRRNIPPVAPEEVLERLHGPPVPGAIDVFPVPVEGAPGPVGRTDTGIAPVEDHIFGVVEAEAGGCDPADEFRIPPAERPLSSEDPAPVPRGSIEQDPDPDTGLGPAHEQAFEASVRKLVDIEREGSARAGMQPCCLDQGGLMRVGLDEEHGKREGRAGKSRAQDSPKIDCRGFRR